MFSHLSYHGFPQFRLGPLLEKRQFGKIRREPNNFPGRYTKLHMTFVLDLPLKMTGANSG